MPLVSYHSTTFDRASAQEAVGTTSSQIFLSRGVADPDGEPATPSQNDSVPSIASTFESSSKHIMTLGEAPRASVVEKSNGTPSAADEISKLPNGICGILLNSIPQCSPCAVTLYSWLEDLDTFLPRMASPLRLLTTVAIHLQSARG